MRLLPSSWLSPLLLLGFLLTSGVGEAQHGYYPSVAKSYTATGTLLSLSGTAFSVKEGTLTTGRGCTYVTGTGIVCDSVFLTAEVDPIATHRDVAESLSQPWTWENASYSTFISPSGNIQMLTKGNSDNTTYEGLGMSKTYGSTGKVISFGFPTSAPSANATYYMPSALPGATYLLNMTIGGVIGYDTKSYLTAETDPQVDKLTNAKWCIADGTAVQCDTNPPVTAETDPIAAHLDGANTWTAEQSITLDGNNAATEFMKFKNSNEPATGQTGDTASISFDFMGTTNSGGAFAAHEAARIEAYKVSDFWHATTEADHDSGLKFYTTDAGTVELGATLDNGGGFTLKSGAGFNGGTLQLNGSANAAKGLAYLSIGNSKLIYEGDSNDGDEFYLDWGTAFDAYDAAGDAGDITASFPAATGTVCILTIGASPAATCVPGQVHIDTDETDDTNVATTADNSIIMCVATNTWVVLENN